MFFDRDTVFKAFNEKDVIIDEKDKKKSGYNPDPDEQDEEDATVPDEEETSTEEEPSPDQTGDGEQQEEQPAEDTPNNDETQDNNQEEQPPADNNEDDGGYSIDDSGEETGDGTGEEGAEEETPQEDNPEEDNAGDGDDTGGEDNTDEESEEDPSNISIEDLKNKETEISGLDNTQIAMRDKELKMNFKNLFVNLDTISNNMSYVTSTKENHKIIEFVTKKVSEVKENIVEYISNIFNTRTYIQNCEQYDMYLLVLTQINELLEVIKDEKGNKNEGIDT